MIKRGSYKNDHVLLNINKSRNNNKMRGLSSILSLFFCKELNKCNKTRAQMLSYDIEITSKLHFCGEIVIILSFIMQRNNGCYNVK